MSFANSVWKILVAIKDGLVLLFLLLFFAAIYAALASQPSPGRVREGALYLALNGGIVEESAQVSPTSFLLSGEAPQPEYLERDLVRALESAATDTRIKAVVLDLEHFSGGSGVQIANVGAALDKVRAAKKPVLARSLIYTDDAIQLAAHATEAWIDPMGGVAISGPGGSMLYYKGLLDRLKVTANVFKVGTYKSAVEPFIRSGSSPESREALNAVLQSVWQNWQDDVKRARPKADYTLAITDPARWVTEAGGDSAQAAVKSGMIDRVGDRIAFGQRVAELVGAEKNGPLGAFKATELGVYLADKPASQKGKAVAVVTVAGDIVDGNAGPGTAGGDRISDLLDAITQSDDYAALVLRVDSPGGSVLASERIRAAVERVKAKGLPIAVSMGSMAASGGYWVSTPAQRIFAEPSTITGSIGVFAVFPSFEAALPEYGVTSERVGTTPLSGQPDLLGGITPQVAAVMQGQIDQSYARFIGFVAKSRGKTTADIDKIGQGRIWDGGTARQLGLVDEFGGVDEAVAWAAKKAGAKEWHAAYIQSDSSPFVQFLQQMETGKASGKGAQDLAGVLAARQLNLLARIEADVNRLISGGGMRAYCLECVSDDRVVAPHETGKKLGLIQMLARLLG